MGRTIPSFRIASKMEYAEWKNFQRALPKADRKLSKSDLYSILRNREESAKSKEKRAEAAYKYFNEPVLSEIIRWDRISIQKETEEIVSKDMQLISQQRFDRNVFQDNINHFYNFIKSKLAETEQN
jgi:hypothetical protein